MNQAEMVAIIREIIATLKYQEIIDLIGRSLHISSAETAPEEVLEQCRDMLPISTQFYKPELTVRERTIAQYGILDLTYSIDPTVLVEIQPGGESLAQELGLFQDRDLRLEDGDDGELDLWWELDLWTNLTERQAYVRLFLRMWEELTPEERENRRQHGLPSHFFVNSYRMIDACLANSSWVWFQKHFYG